MFTGGVVASDNGLPAEEWRSDQGFLRVWIPAPSVFATRIEGRAVTGFTGVIIRMAEQEIAAGRRLLVFHDWEEARSYEPAAREKIVAWTETIRPQWDGSHILFRSSLVAMAVSVSSLLFGEKVTSYSSRKNWQRALDVACASHARR